MNPPDAPRHAGTMSPEAWARVRALVEEALTLSGDARCAFFEASCGDDAVLRLQVERLADACERADDSWGFLAHPAGELVAPLLSAEGLDTPGRAARADLPPEFYAAIADRYQVGAEIGRGGMATVYGAEDLRHRRRVALKVLDSNLGAMLGAERFLAEIQVTARLQHPNLLPLFDSGEAGGLLYYVMPLVEGATLRERLQRERQLPVDEAVRIVRLVAGALDYAHRQGVVHRDLKPENILLQDDQPLVADFGISLAVARAASPHQRLDASPLGTPRYMSPEQVAGDPATDGRSDVYSLACVLYEILTGEPPFSGRTADIVIAKAQGERPRPVRTLRPSTPPHVEAALSRALAKLPADRHGSAREFADALVGPPISSVVVTTTSLARRRARAGVALGTALTVVLATAVWLTVRPAETPAETTKIPFHNLIDLTPFSSISMTPNGRALVYTGSAEAGRPIMLMPLDELTPRALPGTQGGIYPLVSPDGRHLAFVAGGNQESISLDGLAATGGANTWRYGNGGWADDGSVVGEDVVGRGLLKRAPGEPTSTVLTKRDTTRGEIRHSGPLVLPDGRNVVFTVAKLGGRGLLVGPLAIAPLVPTEPLSHAWIGVDGRRAFAFVDDWLLYTSPDGLAIMAVRLDPEGQRVVGTPIPVLRDPAGDLETASLADNGTLLYVRRPRTNAAVRVDASGAARPLAGSAGAPFMYPRLSPDGDWLAVQRSTPDGGNDIWVYATATGVGSRLTTTGRALHPSWTSDSRNVVYMSAGLKGLMSQPLDGSAPATTFSGTEGAFAPDVLYDGSIVYQVGTPTGWNIWWASLQPGIPPRKVMEDAYMPAISPDGRWLAGVSDRSGQNEVYVQPFPGPGIIEQVSDGGGVEPAWSRDGTQIYYRTRGTFMAADITLQPFTVISRRPLFRDAFDAAMPHRNYDVTRDGEFHMIAGGTSEAVVVLNWLAELRQTLARQR